MPSTIDASGLTLESKSQIVADLKAGFQAIYGPDINVESNSPDGQLINLFAQSVADLQELLQDAYNGMAVASAYGARLDQLVALNGLARRQGTYTQAQVLVTVNQALTLPGLDQTALTPFTVADGAGNQFELVTSNVFGGAGSATLTFQSAVIGQVETIANTLTNIVTATLGVTSVNNPSTAADTVGVSEETDAQLKVRHARSFNLAATGPSDSLEAALKQVAGVVDAYVVENNTGGTVNGVAAHTVWPVVRGGLNAAIGAAIYAKKSPGCGLKGSVTQLVARPNGATFLAAWDAAIAQALYIKFSLLWNGPQALANADIIAALAAALTFKLGQNPSIKDFIIALQTIVPTAIVLISATQGVSTDGITWASQVQPTDAQHYFTVAAVNISIV